MMIRRIKYTIVSSVVRSTNIVAHVVTITWRIIGFVQMTIEIEIIIYHHTTFHTPTILMRKLGV